MDSSGKNPLSGKKKVDKEAVRKAQEVARAERAQSHALLNYTLSALQGKFAQLNILIQLKHESAEATNAEDVRGMLEYTNQLLGKLWQGEPLVRFGWTSPQTDESRDVFNFLEQLKGDLASSAEEIERIHRLPDPVSNATDVSFLVAALARYSYSRENYIKGFILYAKQFGIPEMENQYQQFLPPATQDVKVAHLFLKAWRDKKDIDESYFAELKYRTHALIGAFRTHMHDITLLLCMYQANIEFEHVGIDTIEAEEWKRHKLTPNIAGYWRAYRIAADEAFQWLSLGVGAPGMASEWRELGFLPDLAIPWIRQNFPAPVARRWHKSGFTPEQALNSLGKGIHDPSEVP